MIVRGKLNRFAISNRNGKSFFRINILNKTGTLMKLTKITKNLVTIPSSLWTGYLIGTRYLGLH